MKPFDVVMISMSNYTEWVRGVSNRNYHVLQELLRNENVRRVVSVDYPPRDFKRAIRSFTDNVRTSIPHSRFIRHTPFDSLRKIDDKLFVATVYDYFWRKARFANHLRGYIRSFGLSDVVLWSFVPYAAPFIRALGQQVTIFDAVDNWSEHASYQPYRQEFRNAYQLIADEADIIFTVSHELQNLFNNQPNVYWIPNGVDTSHYRTQRTLINRDIADLPRPIVGYIGVVQDRVDTDLIVFLAQKNPTKSFVIVGPVWNETDAAKLKSQRNIYTLGYKPYEEAPAYIQQFDVGIIPHRPSSFVTSTNPMKLYEYLACGIPVVATAGAGAEQFSEHVSIGTSPEDFNRKLFMALEGNTPEARTARIKAVAPFSWAATVQHMVDIVQKKLPG